MIEDELRASFARHEPQAPAKDVLRRGIDGLTIRRRQRRIAVRTSGVAAIVAVVMVAVPLALHRARPGNPIDVLLPGISLSSVPDRALNLLLLGLDTRTDSTQTVSRSDSITLVHITADRQKIYLVDFERDLQVDIPGYGRNKINAAYSYGGMPLLGPIIESLTGVTLDGSVVVTQAGLSQVIDALGGVQICLTQPATSIHTGRTFPPGCQSLDGAGIADLTRQRVDQLVGAYDRDRNIQRALFGLMAKASSLNLLTDAGKLLALARTDGVTVDLGGIDPVALAAELHGLTANDLIGIVSPQFQPLVTTNGANEQLDPVVTPELFAALRNETLDQFVVAHPDWVVSH